MHAYVYGRLMKLLKLVRDFVNFIVKSKVH